MKHFPIITEIEPEVLHGAMDSHAKNIAIAFGEYLKKFKWNGSYWENSGGLEWSTDLMYKKFLNEITCKNVSQDVSAS
jgi:hypothetical protein